MTNPANGIPGSQDHKFLNPGTAVTTVSIRSAIRQVLSSHAFQQFQVPKKTIWSNMQKLKKSNNKLNCTTDNTTWNTKCITVKSFHFRMWKDVHHDQASYRQHQEQRT